MTSSEFAAARKALGLTQEEMASDLDLTPHVIAGMENGEARVPKSIAQDLEWRVALAQRDALLEASGLAECLTMKELDRSAEGKSGEELLKIGERLIAHMESCPTCKARGDYLDKYGPPMPDRPLPTLIRVVGWVQRLLNRVPEALKPPKGKKGEGRRTALGIAAIFSTIAIAIALFSAIAGIVSGFHSNWWRQPLGIAIVPFGYFLAALVGGTVYDFTRPIAHRFIGYVLRGGLIVPAVYGSVGLVMPFFVDDFSWSDWPGITLALAIVGAVGGALLWVIHRVRGKLPSPAA
jgi:DNA-binding XRE family transcriptional regulator